jgi:hypothetical protein
METIGLVEFDDSSLADILGLREQAVLQDAWVSKRLDVVIPMLMQREGVDM